MHLVPWLHIIQGEPMQRSSSTQPGSLALTKQLLAIPSYVDATHNEVAAVTFLEEFVQEHIPGAIIERQYIADSDRFNLIVRGKNQPRLFFLGHIDTVRPKEDWSTDPFEPILQGDALYGLGAADMKGSLAAFLCALVEQKQAIDDIMLLVYVDEEYDFAGMIEFVQSGVLASITPELIISLDGTLELSSGCRGLVEITATLGGKSGHSSNPANGVNAITGTVYALLELEMAIRKYSDAHLGVSTLNVAYLHGGVVSSEAEPLTLQREGNVIPDFADVTFEIRVSNAELTAAKTMQLFTQFAEQQGLSIQSAEIRHDIKPWPVAYDSEKVTDLERAYTHAGVACKKAARQHSGYIDAQMIAENIDVPTFIIGAGGQNKHGADEHVPIKNLEDATRLFGVILRQFL